MTRLYIFTAGIDAARKHWYASIARPINEDIVFEAMGELDQDRLRQVRDKADGFYAWGAVEGKKNRPDWEKMSIGDYVLGAFDNSYRCISRVLDKFDSEVCANKIWEPDPERGPYRYMYFLERPKFIDRPYSDVIDYLYARYSGFTRISDERVNRIEGQYGSLATFVEERIRRSVSPIPNLDDLLDDDDEAESGPQSDIEDVSPPSLDDVANQLMQEGVFNPEDIEDARERVFQSIVRRRGQPKFRKELRLAYGDQCAVTGMDCSEALEAAHIVPYMGDDTNNVTNGLLLRSDIHTLFDCGLISINTKNMTLVVAPSLEKTKYAFLKGKSLHLPVIENKRPNLEALDAHRKAAGLE